MRIRHVLTTPVLAAYVLAETVRRGGDADSDADVGACFRDVIGHFQARAGAEENSVADKELASVAETAREDYANAMATADGKTPGKPGRQTAPSTVAGLKVVLAKRNLSEEAFKALSDKEKAKIITEARTLGKYLSA